MAVFEWTEETPVTANNLNVMQEQNQDEVDRKIAEMGKTLWEGSFTSGTLNVPNISDYKLIAIYVGSIMMLGNQYYGGTTFTTYAQLTISSYGYRYTYNATNETLTTYSNNRCATSGGANVAITKIVGLI